MVIDRSDNLYVSDGDSIFKFTPDGNKSPFATGIDTFEMVIDGSDNLYFSHGDSIFKFTPDGNGEQVRLRATRLSTWPLTEQAISLWRIVTTGQSSNLRPREPRALLPLRLKLTTLVLDNAGNLFVSHGVSHSIFKFAPDGNRSTFARTDISPDMKWECQVPDDATGPKIVKAGTNEAALDLSDECRGSVDWAPNSKRFAF